MKIGFTGTQSVGKTTLVKEIAKWPEFKDYKICVERSEYLSGFGIPLNDMSTYEGQFVFLAERATELMQDDVIADRTVIDVIAFTNRSKQIGSKYLGDVFEKAASPLIHKYDVIFYLPPYIGIENNGIREIDEKFRKEIDDEIRAIVARNSVMQSIPFYILNSVKLESRIEEIKKIFEKNKLLKVQLCI